MLKLLLWCVLFVVCWPLALVVLLLYPVVWLLLLPFRIVGIAVDGVLSLLWALLTVPARLLGAGPRRREYIVQNPGGYRAWVEQRYVWPAAKRNA